MARVQFDIETEIPPDRIVAALTDFSDARPDIWPGLKREEYQVYEVKGTTALVREGSGGKVWAKERYDWSKPGVVRWEVLDSGFCRPGSYVQAEVRPKGSGSVIHVTWERRPKGLLGATLLGVIVLTRGAPVKSSIKKGLAQIGSKSETN